MNESSGSITAEHGALYLDVALYVQRLAAVPTVVPLRDAEDLLVLLVREGASGGGYLVRIRNALGDRVVHAAEFLCEHRFEDSMERSCRADWSEARGGARRKRPLREGVDPECRLRVGVRWSQRGSKQSKLGGPRGWREGLA